MLFRKIFYFCIANYLKIFEYFELFEYYLNIFYSMNNIRYSIRTIWLRQIIFDIQFGPKLIFVRTPDPNFILSIVISLLSSLQCILPC